MIDTDAFRVGYYLSNRYFDIIPGYSADMILESMLQTKMICNPIVLGHDEEGLIIEWHYPDVIFTLEYSTSEFSSGYVVQKIEIKNEEG